jgi:hypothetical protein
MYNPSTRVIGPSHTVNPLNVQKGGAGESKAVYPLSLGLELFPSDDGGSREDHDGPKEDQPHAVWDASHIAPK